LLLLVSIDFDFPLPLRLPSRFISVEFYIATFGGLLSAIRDRDKIVQQSALDLQSANNEPLSFQ